MAGRDKKPGWKISASGAENAKRVLPWLAARFFEAGREVVGVGPSARSLHKLRLRGKRLRYSLELFAPCYGAGLDPRLNELKKVQSYLGEISDCEATALLIKKSKLKNAPDGARFAAFLKTRKQEHIARFVAYWPKYFDAPGRLEAWLFYLENYAAGKPTGPQSAS